MRKVVAEDLAAIADVSPEIPAGLGETAREWWLGQFGVDKRGAYAARASSTWPRWRDHFSHPVTERMRLRIEPFERSGNAPGLGVVLVVPEEDFEQLVGWVGQARADEVRASVDFLNEELAAIWSMWDAAGRPRGGSSSVDAAALVSVLPVSSAVRASATPPDLPPRDDRVGRRFASGRFELVRWLGTDALMGAAIARDHDDGATVRLTFAGDVAASPSELHATLAREVPGLAPVVYLGEPASDDGWAGASLMLAERLPDDVVELELPSGPARAQALVEVGARLVGVLRRVHQGGAVLGTLRPESTFVTADGALALACRGERLWLMPRPGWSRPAMISPWRPGYLAPELCTMLPLVMDPDPAADVYSVGVMLASALLGELCYVAASASELLVKQRAGAHLPMPETAPGRLLARCLRPDPAARPRLDELEVALRVPPGGMST
jgi:hypothetical protein